jgi:hypothetical protein
VWFLPQITMQVGTSLPDGGQWSAVANDGKTVIVHYERRPAHVHDSQTGMLLARVSATELGLYSVTRLPQWLLFKTHPDNDAATDLQVEVDFDDYRTVNGIAVPFHIKKLINHNLVLELKISDVQLQSAQSAP